MNANLYSFEISVSTASWMLTASGLHGFTAKRPTNLREMQARVSQLLAPERAERINRRLHSLAVDVQVGMEHAGLPMRALRQQ